MSCGYSRAGTIKSSINQTSSVIKRDVAFCPSLCENVPFALGFGVFLPNVHSSMYPYSNKPCEENIDLEVKVFGLAISFEISTPMLLFSYTKFSYIADQTENMLLLFSAVPVHILVSCQGKLEELFLLYYYYERNGLQQVSYLSTQQT